VRVRQVLRSDGTRGDGWEVRINRPPQQELRHVARSLEGATTWARQHWQPAFLVGLVAGLVDGPHVRGLYKQAALGDFTSFRVLLDAVREAGRTIDEVALMEEAREVELFVGDAPETADELRELRRRAEAWAGLYARKLARDEYQKGQHVPRGICTVGDSRACVFYDNRPSVGDPGRRLRAIETGKQRLQAEGIDVVSQTSYPLYGEEAGHTVWVVFFARDEQATRILEVMTEAITQAASQPTLSEGVA
jgi:hypothetical protein